MSIALPEPVAAYFTANNVHDIDAMLAPFSEAATVKDEGQDRRGRAAIRAWMDDTNRKYQATVDATDVADTDGTTVVTAQVSGTFPGSPVELRYVFTLAGSKISRLEIHS